VVWTLDREVSAFGQDSSHARRWAGWRWTAGCSSSVRTSVWAA